MADKSKIEWCDATWQVVSGCDEVSDGCRNCYSAALCHGRLKAHPRTAGLTRVTSSGRVTWTGEVRCHDDQLDKPLRWRKPRRIFVADRGDLFHDKVPDSFVDKVFRVMARCARHTFIVLTKRPERMRDYLTGQQPGAAHCGGIHWRQDAPARWPLPNVWLGVSIEDQATADTRIPILLDTPAAVRWVSAEPLIGKIHLAKFLNGWCLKCGGDGWEGHFPTIDMLGDGSKSGDEPMCPSCVIPVGNTMFDWVVVGGESGPNARPMHPDWAREIRDACGGASVPFFFKQMTKKTPIPNDLFVREFPDV